MASIALATLQTARQPARQLVGAFVLRTTASTSTSSSRPTSLYTALTSAWAPALPTAALPSLASLIPDTLAGLRELLPPWLLAAPKRRTTHGAKRMRSSNKGLKDKQSEALARPRTVHRVAGEEADEKGPRQTSSRARLAARRNSRTTSATNATRPSDERSTARHEERASRRRLPNCSGSLSRHSSRICITLSHRNRTRAFSASRLPLGVRRPASFAVKGPAND